MLIERGGVERADGGLDARRVGAGHEPHRRLPHEAGRRDEAGAGTRGAHDAAGRGEQREPGAVILEARVDAARAGAAGQLVSGGVGGQGGVGPDDHTQREVVLRAEQAAEEGLDVHRREGVLHRRTGLRAGLRALDPQRVAVAAEAVDEGLGEGADDGRDALGGAPVVAVPPHVVAVVQLGLGRALRRLHTVDVIEPVAAAAARQAVDALDEATAVGGAHLRVALEHPHHGVGADDLRPAV